MAKVAVPYIMFINHAKKITRGANTNNRPVLQGVYHAEDYVAATDGHRLYYATDVYDGSEKNVDPDTGHEIDEGNYPNVSNLIPKKGTEVASFELRVDEFYETIRAIEIINRIGKATDLIQFEHNREDYMRAGTDGSAAAEVVYAIGTFPSEPGDWPKVLADLKYVKEAFMLYRDAKVEKVTLKFYKENHPFTIEAGNMTALIMPIRETTGGVY